MELDLSSNALNLLEKRYLQRDEQGEIMESPQEMFERVAGNIASAEEDADKEEFYRDQFYQLLTDLKFLPNSPTLMNAGAELQQLAACFVLPVDDSMEGIFTAVKNAALIHKCLAEDTWIKTEQGMKKIKDIVVGDNVLDRDGNYHKVLDVIPTGKKKVYKFQTSKGTFFTATKDHKFLTVTNLWKERYKPTKNSELKYKSLDEIKENDGLILSNLKEETGKLQKLDWEYEYKSKPELGHFKNKDVNIPDIMNENLAWLLGFFVGDGSYHNDGIRFTLNSQECEAIKEKLVEAIEQLFQVEASYNQKNKSKDGIAVYRAELKEFFNQLLNGNKHNIPQIIFNSPKEVRWAFLSGLIDSDGCIKKTGHIDISTSYEELYHKIKGLYTSLGVHVGVTCVNKNSDYRTGYQIHPITKDGYNKCYKNLKLYHTKKKERLIDKNLSNRGVGEFKEYKFIRLRDVIYYGEVQTYNLTVENVHEYTVSQLVSKNSGGGTGFSFSRLRPKDDVVQTTGGVSSGPLSFMKVFNRATDTVKQGGKRRGANMGMLRVDHPDILDFINAKGELTQENQELYDEFKETLANTNLQQAEIEEKLDQYKRKLLDNQFANFNLSVGVTEEFMTAVEAGDSYDLINPRTEQKVGELDAQRVFDLIVNYAWQNGEPGIVFLDEINKQHPLPAEIEATNPCGEQPLLPNEACNLGSINLSKFVTDGQILWDELEETIELAVRFLDNVITVNRFPLEEIEEQVEKYRKIGLGVMGFHELLIRLGIAYDSEEAVKTAEKIMKFINETAHQYSRQLAEEKEAFPEFEASEYEIPQRNATLTTIAPTGSISFLGGTSGGIEPFFSFEYSHTDADGNVSQFKYDFTEEAPEEALVTALEIAPEWHVRIQAAFQEHVDNAVSKTINFPNQASREDIGQAYQLAYDLGCKGLTVYRNGSRTAQVLNTENKEEKTVAEETVTDRENRIYPETRPLAAAGETIKYDTGCGKLYLTINLDETGDPIETFLTTGSDGGCQVMTEAVSRLTSLALRSGVAPEEIIDQLRSTSTCPSFMYERGKGKNLEGKSCPDVVGRALKEIIESKTFQHLESDLEVIEKMEEAQAKAAAAKEEKADGKQCPECGAGLHFEEGCSTCSNCGYSNCG